VRKQKLNPVPGIDRREHGRIIADVDKSHHRENAEPHHHHRTERRCDPGRAAALHREQHDQMNNVSGTNIMFERRCCELETLDGRKHRDRRRIMESPRNIEAPITPSASSGQLRRPNARCPSVISESVPPSPLLSARSSSRTYLA